MVKDCKSCIHSRVCKLKDKYEQYQNEMLGLIAKWGKDNPFGFSTDCPEYHIALHTGITRDTKPKSDLDIWVEHEKNINNPFKYEPKITYDWETDCEDEITTTVEDKLKSAAKSSNECKEDEYDFLKELEKISMKNKIYFL